MTGHRTALRRAFAFAALLTAGLGCVPRLTIKPGPEMARSPLNVEIVDAEWRVVDGKPGEDNKFRPDRQIRSAAAAEIEERGPFQMGEARVPDAWLTISAKGEVGEPHWILNVPGPNILMGLVGIVGLPSIPVRATVEILSRFWGPDGRALGECRSKSKDWRMASVYTTGSELAINGLAEAAIADLRKCLAAEVPNVQARLRGEKPPIRLADDELNGADVLFKSKRVEMVDARKGERGPSANAVSAFPPPSSALSGRPAGTKRLAVLEFQGALGRDLLELLSDQVRATVLAPARVQGFSVMTRESIAVVLAEMGRSAAQCSEGECEVEVGRNVGADAIITGRIIPVEGINVVTLKLHETRTGALLSTAEARGAKAIELVDAVKAAADRLLQ